MMRPFVEAVRMFKSQPFGSYGKAGLRYWLRKEFPEPGDSAGTAHSRIKKRKEREDLQGEPKRSQGDCPERRKGEGGISRSIGVHSRYLGEYVALRGFMVVDHGLDLHRLGQRVFSTREEQDEIVVTNVGTPKKIVTVEI